MRLVSNDESCVWGGGSNLSDTVAANQVNSYYASRADMLLNYGMMMNNLDNYTATASKLEVSDDAFSNANTAIGTDALDLLKGQQLQIRNLANNYRMHVVDGISPLLYNSVDNINNATKKLSGNIYFQK